MTPLPSASPHLTSSSLPPCAFPDFSMQDKGFFKEPPTNKKLLTIASTSSSEKY